MNRGDIIVVAPPSPFNKPRPAVIIQERYLGELETVIVALITSDLSFATGFRVPIQPTATNGLRKSSEIMVDNVQTARLDHIGGIIGKCDPDTLADVDAGLRLFLGLP